MENMKMGSGPEREKRKTGGEKEKNKPQGPKTPNRRTSRCDVKEIPEGGREAHLLYEGIYPILLQPAVNYYGHHCNCLKLIQGQDDFSYVFLVHGE